MFTGIVEELGTVSGITRGSKESRIEINCSKVLEDVRIGDSIAVNGVCLTVVEFNEKSFKADVMNETFARSSLSDMKANTRVNLERAMALGDRFGGHIVSGHIDGVGTIKSVKRDANAHWFEISTDASIMEGIVEKGSIAIDGISLTVASVYGGSFSVSVIPHTLAETTLGYKGPRDVVNLENDLIGKYIKEYVKPVKGGGLTREYLISNGF